MKKETFKALYESLKEGVEILKGRSNAHKSYTIQDIVEAMIIEATHRDSDTRVIRKDDAYILIGRIAQKLNELLFGLDNNIVMYHNNTWEPLFENREDAARYQGGDRIVAVKVVIDGEEKTYWRAI